jgi:hypothetical protein
VSIKSRASKINKSKKRKTHRAKGFKPSLDRIWAIPPPQPSTVNHGAMPGTACAVEAWFWNGIHPVFVLMFGLNALILTHMGIFKIIIYAKVQNTRLVFPRWLLSKRSNKYKHYQGQF